MGLNVEQSERRACAVIKVSGDVDLYSSPDLRATLVKTIPKTQCETVAVDLSEVAYMDSSGVATLVEGLQRSQKQKKRFCLLAPANAVMKVLHLARLDTVFDIRAAL
jgi:anti-sigma B factor antagonist